MTEGIQTYHNGVDVKNEGNRTEDFVEFVLPKISTYCVYKRKALDVGCGNGRLSTVICEMFDKTIAIDKHLNLYNIMKNDKVVFLNKDIYDIDCDHSYDLVMLWASLYLNKYPGLVLKFASKLLSPTGTILIAEDKKRSDLVSKAIIDSNLLLLLDFIIKDYIQVWICQIDDR